MQAADSDIASPTQAKFSLDAVNFENRVAVVDEFLPGPAFDDLLAEVEKLAGAVRSYVPTHKKGGTFSYSTIRELAPAIADFYHSDDLREFISRTVGVGVKCTPQHDQSSLSVLVYDRPGDHIAWHYDHNFYRGRHFTVLLPVVNVGSCAGGLSHAQLVVKAGETDRTIQAAANTLVVFEGAKVLHKVTPVQADERRIVVSMTFCQDPRTTTLRGAARRIKDTAFFGMRALWM